MTNKVLHILQAKLDQRRASDAFRSLKADTELIDFASNDYLGLSRDRRLRTLITQTTPTSLRLGSGGSRLLAGNSDLYMEVENDLSRIFKAESALLFNSGYAANLGFFSAIPQRGDLVLHDELIHACVKDGIRLGVARKSSFPHNDLKALEKKLSLTSEGNVFVAVESIYSMDGDTAPLSELCELCDKFGAFLVVDEAHSTGVYGEGGAGLCCELELQERVFARIHTFGKGPGIHGACVASNEVVKDYLVNFARSFIYTTAFPDSDALKVKLVFNYIEDNPQLKMDLLKRVELFQSSCKKSNDLASGAIQTVIIPGNNKCRLAAQTLQAQGFDVRPVLSPTVPEGGERLRICLHVHNTLDEVKGLAQAINELDL